MLTYVSLFNFHSMHDIVWPFFDVLRSLMSKFVQHFVISTKDCCVYVTTSQIGVSHFRFITGCFYACSARLFHQTSFFCNVNKCVVLNSKGHVDKITRIKSVPASGEFVETKRSYIQAINKVLHTCLFLT